MDNVANTVISSTQSSEDTLSPTVIIHNYLRSKNLPLTSENINRALEANANNPGVIQGLQNDLPQQSEMDITGERSAPTPVKTNSSASTGDLPIPPIPPANVPINNVSQPNPTTAPVNEQSGQYNITDALMGGAAGGGAAILAKMIQEAIWPKVSGMGINPTTATPGNVPTTRGNTMPEASMPRPANSNVPIDLTNSATRGNLAPPATQSVGDSMNLLGDNASKQLTAPTPRSPIPMPDQTSGPTINLPDETPKPPRNAMADFTVEGKAAMDNPGKVEIEPTTRQGTARAARELGKTDPKSAIEMFRELQKSTGTSFAKDIAKLMKAIRR